MQFIVCSVATHAEPGTSIPGRPRERDLTPAPRIQAWCGATGKGENPCAPRDTHLGYLSRTSLWSWKHTWVIFQELETHLGSFSWSWTHTWVVFPGAGHTPGLFLQDTCVELDGALRADGA